MTEDAVANLYRAYGYSVFRRCMVYLGEPTAAHEVVHQVFARATRSPADVRERATRSLLCRLADELCVELLRQRRRATGTSQPELAAAPPRAIEDAVGDDDRESLLTVRRLLETFELGAQRLAVLYYVDELTEEELAAELGLSRRAIRKRLEQLRSHARALLQEERAS